MKIPQFQFSTDPLYTAQEGMKHVSEHVATIERHDWYEVRETQQNVYPHQPETEMGKEEENVDTDSRTEQAVTGRHQRFFERMDGHTAQFKRDQQNSQHMEGD